MTDSRKKMDAPKAVLGNCDGRLIADVNNQSLEAVNKRMSELKKTTRNRKAT